MGKAKRKEKSGDKRDYAALGRLGGLAGGPIGGRSRSPAKQASSRANGKKGGWPGYFRPKKTRVETAAVMMGTRAS